MEKVERHAQEGANKDAAADVGKLIASERRRPVSTTSSSIAAAISIMGA